MATTEDPIAPEETEGQKEVGNASVGWCLRKLFIIYREYALSPLALFNTGTCILLQSSTKNKRSPSDFLKSVLGRPVRVKLNSGIEYRGVLACLDGYLNIAMEQTEEYVDGQLKARYGDCFIRGNNGKFSRISETWFIGKLLFFWHLPNSHEPHHNFWQCFLSRVR